MIPYLEKMKEFGQELSKGQIRSTEENVKLIKAVEAEVELEIEKVKIYDDTIVFKIRSDVPMGNAVVIPKSFPNGWIVEQKTIKKIEEGKIHTVEVLYEPELWKEAEARVLVVSEDGKYYGQKVFPLEKESGISRFCYLFKSFRFFKCQGATYSPAHWSRVFLGQP